jgi:hypothetical protein
VVVLTDIYSAGEVNINHVTGQASGWTGEKTP